MQQSFRNKWFIFSILVMIAIIFLFRSMLPFAWSGHLIPDSHATIRFVPLAGLEAPPGFTLHGAWTIESEDPRIAGLSALAFNGDRLVTVSDFARHFSFAPPQPAGGEQEVFVRYLRRSAERPMPSWDAEAIAHAAPEEIWISTERHDALWRFEAASGRMLEELPVAGDWPANGGIEALVEHDGDHAALALVERRRIAFVLGDNGPRRIAIRGDLGWPTGGARMADGSVVIVSRTIGAAGFSNRITRLRQEAAALVATHRVDLPLGLLDNMEGIATAPLPQGATRLWLIADDNRAWYQRTLLVAYDVKADAWP